MATLLYEKVCTFSYSAAVGHSRQAVKTQKMVSVTKPPSLPVVDERRMPEASSWYSTTGGSGRALTLVGVVGESGGM